MPFIRCVPVPVGELLTGNGMRIGTVIRSVRGDIVYTGASIVYIGIEVIGIDYTGTGIDYIVIGVT